MGRWADGVAGRLMGADVFDNFISSLPFKFHERKREGWNLDCICSMGDSSPADLQLHLFLCIMPNVAYNYFHSSLF